MQVDINHVVSPNTFDTVLSALTSMSAGPPRNGS